MDALSIYLAPLVFALYEWLIHESADDLPSALESEVMLAEMISAITEKFPQGNITVEDARHWKQVAIGILDRYRERQGIGTDWPWIATVESSFDRLIRFADASDERRPPEEFHEYYLWWCRQTDREPATGELPRAQQGEEPDAG